MSRVRLALVVSAALCLTGALYVPAAAAGDRYRHTCQTADCCKSLPDIPLGECRRHQSQKKVSLRGTVVCAHCDLNQSQSCQTSIYTNRGCVHPVADGRLGKALKAAGNGGELMKVTGAFDANGHLRVASFRVIRETEPKKQEARLDS